MGISLTPEERFEVFGEWSPEEYADEAEERWNGTAEFKESQRRTPRYSKEDWLRIKAEGADIDKRLAAALRAGVAADSEEVMDLAEKHRQHITRYFYECSYDIHSGLGQMFATDARFQARYEEIAAGLSGYVCEAVLANAHRAGGNSLKGLEGR